MRDAQGRGITGARGAAPIWAEFMRKATEGEPQRDFPVPPDIRFVQVNPTTGQAPMPWDPKGMEVALREAQIKPYDQPWSFREPSPTGGGQ